jgi:energy-coupling factor transporter ATP-binding protein EcfA2
MADVTGISLFFGKAAAKWAFNKAASHSTEELKKWIISEAKNDEHNLTEADFKTIDGLLSANRTFMDTIISVAKFWTNGGVTIVGPSGAGKSTLHEFLDKGHLAEPGISTVGADTKNIRHQARKYRVTDTPGQVNNQERLLEASSAIDQESERVLVVVLSAGYLKTEGMTDQDGNEFIYKRPAKTEENNLANYLEICAVEEIEWLESITKRAGKLSPEKRFRSIMIVLNKVDQWWDQQEHVNKYYRGVLDVGAVIPDEVKHLSYERSQKLKGALQNLKSSMATQGVEPTFHLVASAYDSLYNNPPNGSLSRQSALSSLIVFRGELRLRLLEG